MSTGGLPETPFNTASPEAARFAAPRPWPCYANQLDRVAYLMAKDNPLFGYRALAHLL
jgi:hypothetical protein